MSGSRFIILGLFNSRPQHSNANARVRREKRNVGLLTPIITWIFLFFFHIINLATFIKIKYFSFIFNATILLKRIMTIFRKYFTLSNSHFYNVHRKWKQEKLWVKQRTSTAFPLVSTQSRFVK